MELISQPHASAALLPCLEFPVPREHVIQGIHKRMARFQKLTITLFLTLHGHNVHRQQRQLSKFLMRFQQFASHAYCGAAGPVFKMPPRPRSKHEKRTAGSAWETWTVAAADGVRCARVR